jgi:uncharacterized membrane protein
MDTYLLLKTLHIVGAILFLGNIIVTGWWKVAANRTNDPRIVAFAQRQVTLTDWVFTFGGASLVAAAGLGNAIAHDIPLSTPWIAWGLAIFVVAGLLWAAVLVPLQTKLARMARAFADSPAIPAEYWPLERAWIIIGTIDILIPLAVVPVMVFKGG